MATNVADMSAKLSLSAFEFNSGLKQSEQAAMEFANTVQTQSLKADRALATVGTGKKINFASIAQQGGYAIQDFSSQIERGIGPAIGAVTNNIQAMAAGLGPVSAATLGIGAAVGGIVLPAFVDWLNNTKQLAIEAKEVEERFGRAMNIRKGIATLEVEGGAGKAREELQKQIELNEKLKSTMADKITAEQKTLAILTKQNDARFFGLRGTKYTSEVNIGGVFDALAGNKEHQDAVKAGELKKSIQSQQEAYKKLFAEGVDAHEKLNQLGPESLAANKDAELKAQDDFDKRFDENAKRQKDMWAAEADIKKKSLEEYGTAAERMESKIARERAKLAELGVGKEAMDRFEKMSAVDRKRLGITEKEKALSEMGTANGMSAGALRNSAAGVTAINRAVSGTASEQSIAKEHLKTAKESLKQLEQIVRGVSKPTTVVSLSG